jgi:threonine dehydrogenase-like Zn-dependent dehydrogenase
LRAITFVGEGRHALLERPEPEAPAPDGVIVEVAAAGICGSDLQILWQPQRHPATPGIVLGHEFCGTVRAVGPLVPHVKPGDRVAIDPARGCGKCAYCLRGEPEGCPDQVLHGIFQDGGFTRLAPMPGWSLLPLPDDLVWARAALTEPLSVVLAGVRRVPPQPGEAAAVFGAGPIGLLFSAVLGSMGVAPLVVYEPAPFRRELALACGATHAVDAAGGVTADSYLHTTGASTPPSLVVDATGFLLDRAVELVDHGGRILCVGYNTSARPAIDVARVVDRTIAIRGTAGGFGTAALAVEMLAAGRLPVGKIVTDELPLNGIDHALAEMRAGRAGKIVLLPEA